MYKHVLGIRRIPEMFAMEIANALLTVIKHISIQLSAGTARLVTVILTLQQLYTIYVFGFDTKWVCNLFPSLLMGIR